MSRIPRPSLEQPAAPFRAIGVALLALSLLVLLLAPLQMPADYSWLRHTTSESAAQGVTGAWLARLGFLIFGLTVVWLSSLLKGKWPWSVRWMHAAFGVLMTATAAFSTRSWLPDAIYDPIEDGLHSFAATAMGFAFAFGTVLRLVNRKRDSWGRVMDIVAIVAAIAFPLGMSAFAEWDGLLQRGMFAIAYIWYGFELLRVGNT